MDTAMDIFALILECITLYTAVIGVLFLFPLKKQVQTAPQTRFAVLIAARNEEPVISGLIESLLRQNYPKELFDIYVENCKCKLDTRMNKNCSA